MHFCKLYRSLCLVVLLLGLAAMLQAQEFRSTLAGRVTDPQGGVIPKVKVTATESSTNSRYTTVTGAEGLYVFPMLPPGNYNLTAETQGFKKYLQTGINIGTASRVSQDIKLELGQVSEAVTVTADAPQLNTINASASQVITTHEVESLPINGRAPMDLAMLGFGVVNNGNRDQNRAFENGGFSSMSMGGAASSNNAVSLDGVPNAGTPGFGGNRAAYSPPVEAVDEVQVSAFNVDASEGGTAGGTVQITTKGGTNALHGSATEFYEGSVLNAKPYATKKGSNIPSTHQNNWSATIGGPIYIPKVVNGKDKAFFFFSYEGLKDAAISVAQSKVPTLEERVGNFSNVAKMNIYDPFNPVIANGKITRPQFSYNGVNNVIDPARLNPVALNFLREFIPYPNQPLVNGINYTYNKAVPDDYSAIGARFDFNLSERNKLTMKFGESGWTQDSGSPFSNNASEYDPARKTSIDGWGVTGKRDIWNAAVDDLYTFTPTLVGNFRLGFSRYRAYYENDSKGYDPTQLGLPSYIRDNSDHLMLTRFTFGDSFASAPGGRYLDQPYNVYQFHTGFTWSKGAHTFKFGGELQLRDFSDVDWSNDTGVFSFDNKWVSQSPTSSFSGKDGAIASFLLGLPANSSTGYTLNSAQKTDSWYRALYVQDDWRVKANLTLNLGLRWESATPALESNNRQTVGFDATAANEITAKALAAYTTPIDGVPSFNPSGVVIMADKNNREAYKTHNMFAPRVGFSWSPDALKGRTVIRGGFGLFYSVWGAIEGTMYNSVPFVSSVDNNWTVKTTLSDPFPNGFTPNILGSSITFNNPDMKNQYSERWSLDIQQQLANDLTLEVGYIGNHSVHLTNTLNLNALPAQYLSRTATRDQATIDWLDKTTFANPMAGLMPWSSLGGPTITRGTMLKAFPEYSGVSEANMTTGGSYYESLAARLSKRFSKGWLMSVNYNFSKLIEQNSYLNAGDPTLEKRLSPDDRPHVLSVAGTYDLPFGKGRKLLNNANPWIDGVLGGWSIAGTYSYHTGAPANLGDIQYLGGDLHWNAHNAAQVFDTTQFNRDSTQKWADHFRTMPTTSGKYRIDSTNNVNFTLSKMFNVMERAKVQFRAEAFNLFNRPIFSGANMDPYQDTFGRITKDPTNTARTLQGGLRLLF